MPVIELLSLPPSGPLLGIDPGQKRIGLALSDTQRLIASPLLQLARGRKLKPTLVQLAAIYSKHDCVGIIIGLPLNMDGSAGPSTQATKAFVYHLLHTLDVPLAYQDERLSSAQAERVMLEADLSRARRAQSRDASAAAIILQTALDRIANLKS